MLRFFRFFSGIIDGRTSSAAGLGKFKGIIRACSRKESEKSQCILQGVPQMKFCYTS